MASVKVIIRSDKTNKKTGLAPLYIRIIKDRKAKFISLGIKIEPKYWNDDKMSIKKGAPNYVELNNYIIQKRADAEKTSIELESYSKNVTSSNIKIRIKGNKPKNFFEYTDKKIVELKYTLSINSLRSYYHQLNKFRTFCGNKNINFHEIDIKLIKKYEQYLLKVIGNKPRTVGSSVQNIRAMFNYAINDGVINPAIYPFQNFQIQTSKSEKNYLNEEQFQTLLNYDVKLLGKNKFYYDMFIFSCYAGGLRFTDVLELKWTEYNEEEQRIIKLIGKTQRKHQFKLPKRAISIIEKYKKANTKPTDYVFPCLNNDLNYKLDLEFFFNEKSKYNKYANECLKKIASNIDLPFRLTFHTSRHTFATRALNKGMRIEHVSKILDHSNISTTQIYAKIINKELDKARYYG